MSDDQEILPRIDTPLAAVESSGGVASHASTLDPELRGIYARRLAAVALFYAAVYAVVQSYFWGMYLFGQHTEPPRLIHNASAAIAISAGLAVAWMAHRRELSSERFTRLAIAFEICAGLGIIVNAWGWEGHSDELPRATWLAIEPTGADAFQQGFIEPLLAAGIRLIYIDGLNWVAMWIVMYPLIVPMSPRATLVASSITAASVPVVHLLSLLAHGVPDSVRAWVLPLLFESTIPTMICAGIAVYGATFVHRLASDLSKARRLGSYRLETRIGTGGMGEVWRARHKLLVRPAAIKLIRPRLALGAGVGSEDGTLLRRFEREAQATALLSSPHTVELYDFGVTDDGALYYVMELLAGVDLKTLVERHGPVPAERTVHLLRQACHSLADAELAGLVHRDIKPANLFACRKGRDYDFLKVLDFGLVKSIGGTKAGAQLTEAGVVSGTPTFMAPEMAFGDGAVDGRADLYSLGCVAYWLLTGRLVFDEDTPMKTMLHHLQEPPVAPSTVTELEVPDALDRVVLWCLEKTPDRRPADARALADALADIEGSLPRWSEERAARWWGTHLPHVGEPAPSVG